MYGRPFSTQENTQNYFPYHFCDQIPLLQNQQPNVIHCPTMQQNYPNITNKIMSGYCPGAQQNYPNMINGVCACYPVWQQEHSHPNLANGMAGFCPVGQQGFSNTFTFTFNRNAQDCSQLQNFSQWQSPPTQNLAQMQRYNQLNQLHLQKLLNDEPYLLKFHMDNQTSCTDLGTKIHNQTDFKNQGAILLKQWPLWLQKPISKNHKKLVLRNVTTKQEESILDGLEENNEKKDEKSVSFNLDDKEVEYDKENSNCEKKHEGCQVKLCCECDENDLLQASNIRRKKKKKRHKKSASETEHSADDEDRC